MQVIKYLLKTNNRSFFCLLFFSKKSRLFQKRGEGVTELSVIIDADKIKIRKINTFVVAAGTVIITEEDDLVVRETVFATVAVKGEELVIWLRRHIKRR